VRFYPERLFGSLPRQRGDELVENEEKPENETVTPLAAGYLPADFNFPNRERKPR